MEVNGGVAERIERRLDALGLRPEEVDAKVGLPPGTTERLRSGQGPIPGGRFLRGLCAALDTDEAYLLGLEPGDLVPAELLVDDYDLVTPGGGAVHPLLALAEFLPQAKDVGLHVVVARRCGGAGRALFDPVLGRVRELGAPGLVLNGSPDEGALLKH